MKKFFLFALMLGLTVSLTACGSDGADGAAGLKGDTGDTGDTGPTGPTGPGAGLYDFKKDVLPLFTTAGSFYSGSQACNGASCHDGTAHEFDMSSYNSLIAGADGKFVSVLGQKDSGGSYGGDGSAQHPSLNGVNWDKSKMKERLRNNRMPPGWAFGGNDETNRDTLEIKALELWVKGGALETEVANTTIGWDTPLASIKKDNADGTYGITATHTVAQTWQLTTGTPTIESLFTAAGAFFSGSQACNASSCHDGTAHELDLSTYAGLIAGADGKGVSILGQKDTIAAYGYYGNAGSATTPTAPGTGLATDTNWSKSKIRERLRNNRMPPNWTFGGNDESNRDTPEINLIGAWIKAGALENVPFLCSGTCPDPK
ncbi:MAG: hypothetical protein OEY64_03410 [Nitrospinota bacterium]|nr:hypothetical protein [Nitrospinota bacterium]